MTQNDVIFYVGGAMIGYLVILLIVNAKGGTRTPTDCSTGS